MVTVGHERECLQLGMRECLQLGKREDAYSWA